MKTNGAFRSFVVPKATKCNIRLCSSLGKSGPVRGHSGVIQLVISKKLDTEDIQVIQDTGYRIQEWHLHCNHWTIHGHNRDPMWAQPARIHPREIIFPS